MKKAILILVVICVLFSAAGCAAVIDPESVFTSKEVVFTIDDYQLQITADETFEENTGGAFDLQLTNKKSYISVMAYKYMDLPEGMTTQDVYKMQNEDLFSKRTAVTAVEEVKTQTLSQKSITYATYSAEKDGVKNYYVTYLVDIPQEETFAWVLVTAAPSYMDHNQEYLHNIVCSLTSNG